MVLQETITPEVYTQQSTLGKEVSKGPLKPGQLTDEQLRCFFEDGFVLIEDLLTPNDLDPACKAICQLVETLAQRLYKAGKIKSLYSEYGFYDRLIKLENDFPGAVILLHKEHIMPPEIQNVFAHEKLLNIVEQLVGPRIAGAVVWNLRTKTPRTESVTVPWHQDNAYTDERSYNHLVPTAWIPLLDADEKNGCLELARGAHRTGKMVEHVCCSGDTWYLMFEPEVMQKELGVDLAKDLIKVPVRYGSVLLFNNIIPHRSLDNFSDKVRWSLDLRWQNADLPDMFYGLKQPILLRDPAQPDLKPDWDRFNGIGLKSPPGDMSEESSGTSWHKLTSVDSENQFDTTIYGPWMNRWKIVYKNRHTDKFDEKNKDDDIWYRGDKHNP